MCDVEKNGQTSHRERVFEAVDVRGAHGQRSHDGSFVIGAKVGHPHGHEFVDHGGGSGTRVGGGRRRVRLGRVGGGSGGRLTQTREEFLTHPRCQLRRAHLSLLVVIVPIPATHPAVHAAAILG